MKKLVLGVSLFINSLTYSQIDTTSGFVITESEKQSLIQMIQETSIDAYIQPNADHSQLKNNFLDCLTNDQFDVIDNVIKTKNFSLVYYDLQYKIENSDTIMFDYKWNVYDDLYDSISKTYIDINIFKEFAKHIPYNDIKIESYSHTININTYDGEVYKFISKLNKNQIYEIDINWINNQINSILVSISNIK